MLKFLIYTVAIAILAVLGFDAYAVITHTATPLQAVEAAVGLAAILAIAVAAFVKSVSGSAWPSFRKRKVTLDELSGNVDSLSEDLDDARDDIRSVRNSVDDVSDDVNDIKDTLDSRLGPTPCGYVATINSTDENGKLFKVYDLPVEETYEEALDAARESVRAREAEGAPVTDARITVVPVFSV